MAELRLFVAAARHLETLLAEEARALGCTDARETHGGVLVTGNLRDAYRLCLWSRVANRVLLPLARFVAADAAALYAGARAIDWSAHLGPESSFAVHCETAHSQLDHAHFAALKIKDALVDQFRERFAVRPSVARHRPDIQLYCRLFRDEATLSLDVSGESLHRRGYREQVVAASMKETLAAAVLLRARWPDIAAAGGALLDPMCGAGTLPIEAALMAADSAPGLNRAYWGFGGWRGHDAALWRALLDEAQARRAAGLARLGSITGYDRNPAAIRAALGNLERAGLAGRVHFECRELGECRPRRPRERGLLVVNPPYGERLAGEGDLDALHARLGSLLRERFDGWRAALLTGTPELGKRMGLRAERLHRLFNGPIECQLLHFDIGVAAHVNAAPRPLPADEHGPGARMFANRLRKNLKATARWRREQSVSCYRLYDADLPEYALAIDLYASADTPGRLFAHVQEYAAPATVAADSARRRLREALAVLGAELGIAAGDLFFKVRQRQKGRAQYERQADTGRFHRVAEDDLRFLVNFEDYLDTGLFLDHRETRRLIRQRAAGTRFLNLFGYTATATCHAARGGARATTTVDLSRTYGDWARRNLELNGFGGREHRLIQADCLDWLARARADRERFDLVFLDPPTFSTSKRMRGNFDVQRDHVALIDAALALLAPGGELIFSNNLRRFQMDQAAFSEYRINDIGALTLPRDFARNPRVRHCWSIRAAADA